MSRVWLVHWNAAEAVERRERLRRAGHEVRVWSKPDGPGLLAALRKTPRDAVVIDLDRLPSHGRAVATALRQHRRTRDVPIAFVGGEAQKIAATRTVLPDATYATWRSIRGALRRAIERPPVTPLVPDTMAGYSGTPLPKKLGIKPDSVVALLGAPRDFEQTLGALPEGSRLRRRPRGTAERVLLFARSRADLERRFAAAVRTMADGGGLWIAWPKRASALATDLTQADVRALGLGNGLVDYKICAIDDTWSGLLFARRKSNTTQRRR